MGRSKRMLLVLMVAGCLLLATASVWAQGATNEGQKEKNLFQLYVIDGGWVVWFIEIPMSIAAVALMIMFPLELRRSVLLPFSGSPTARCSGFLTAKLPTPQKRGSDWRAPSGPYALRW